MKPLPNINISRRDMLNLLRFDAKKYGEAFLCNFSSNSVLYKIFYVPDYLKGYNEDDFSFIRHPYSLSDIDEMSDNKFAKIKKLYELQLEHITTPTATITIDGRLIGYAMDFYYNDATTHLIQSREYLIEYLRKSKAILEYLGSKDIIYGDVAHRNILVNSTNMDMRFCDVDNISLGQYPIDMEPVVLSTYREKRGKIDSECDAYMHNLMAVSDFHIAKTPTFLSRILVNRNFSSNGLRIYESLSTPETFTGEYIIDHVKEKRK